MTDIGWLLPITLVALVVGLIVYRRQRGVKPKQPITDHHVAALEALADADTARALGELQLAVQQGQGGVDAYLRLAELSRSEGQLKKAIHLHRSLAVNTSWSPAVRQRILRGLAEDYLAAGRWDDALTQLDELRKLDARDPAIYRRLCQVYLRKLDGERAEQALKRAHKLEGASRADELAILHSELARRFLAEQRQREAGKAIEEALKLDPNCLPALRLSVDLALHEGKEQEAADALQNLALTAQPGSEDDYQRMEKHFFDLGRYHEIQFVYQEVLSRDPNFWPARFALARILQKRGRRDEAAHLLDPGLEADAATAGRAAALLLDWEQPERARRWLERWAGEAAPRITTYRCRTCGVEHARPRWYCPACHAFKSYEPVREEPRVQRAR